MPGKVRKRWTVLIYMVADDPQGGELLDREAVQEMDHITKAALSVDMTQLYVALQVDFRTLPGVWRRSIGESTFVRPESNAADPATPYGFFDWATAECPADHYLLIFWGHSRGQFGLFGDSDPFDYTAQTLTLDELRTALTAAKRLLQKPMDVIAFKDCFMANLETAYELSGLADYLLASPGLVPVVGWPYEEMFKALTKDDQPLDAGRRILDVLKAYYKIESNRKPHDEVPYSLLSTKGAVPVVKALNSLLGEDRLSVDSADKQLRPLLDKVADGPGDKALADLGQLVGNATTPSAKKKTAENSAPKAKNAAERKSQGNLEVFVQALGNAQPQNTGADKPSKKHADERSSKQPSSRDDSGGLVIAHTGKDFGGVSVFVFPSTPKAQRDSMLTRLADEKAYRRLAISTDTKWADIALGRMPVQQVGPVQDVSKAIALFEQLKRVGVGLDPGSAARANAFLRRRARSFRNGDPNDADVAEAAQYATISELAVRLADFAAVKGGADFVKGGADFVKGGADFVKGGADFVKGGADFVKGGADFGPG